MLRMTKSTSHAKNAHLGSMQVIIRLPRVKSAKVVNTLRKALQAIMNAYIALLVDGIQTMRMSQKNTMRNLSASLVLLDKLAVRELCFVSAVPLDGQMSLNTMTRHALSAWQVARATYYVLHAKNALQDSISQMVAAHIVFPVCLVSLAM